MPEESVQPKPRRSVPIVVLGEILWDVIGEDEHLGGAPFNFAAHARKLGHEVAFVSAVGADPRGMLAIQRAREMGLDTSFVSVHFKQPTGTVAVKLSAGGQPDYTIRRPAAYDFPELDAPRLEQLARRQPEWIYFGTLNQTSPPARKLTREVLAACPQAKRFYDVNLRKDCYGLDLVASLLRDATVVKLNEDEFRLLSREFRLDSTTGEEAFRAWLSKFGCAGICVTRGERGCAGLVEGQCFDVPGKPAQVADAVGAGDAFAAAFVHGLAQGWPPERVAAAANSLGAVVAGREGPIPDWSPAEVPQLG